ncbi:hypothetical protein [Acetobacter vaccinii]|uniref:Uncharacterized protein n=1 Tax=Acetobacter vaccinii TaxID=2592655 RepID=A0A5C1YN43_9PROT|nr:hypothetical protein [Acetobacter vaccinii]QEO16905.1 hypothetical protein FLP30_03350 [Acetobacter vaccinii]
MQWPFHPMFPAIPTVMATSDAMISCFGLEKADCARYRFLRGMERGSVRRGMITPKTMKD